MKQMPAFFKKCQLLLLYLTLALPGICQQSAKKAITGPEKFILRDEGISQLSFEDTRHPENNWYVPIPKGRDMQLIGKGLVLIGTEKGFEERSLLTGEKVNELIRFPGTLSAHRLRNGNTLLTGMNWQDKKGVVLVEVDANGNKVNQIEYGGFTYLRLVRETLSGNLLVAAEDTVFEGTLTGEVIWKVKIAGPPDKPHVWQALRLENGHTIVSTGYAANFQEFDAQGKPVISITGPDSVHPIFFAGFQILSNGNYVVTNWQGHGPKMGESGLQLLEYTPKGELVWSWKQDPSRYSSIQGVIVLDGLDTKLMQTENSKGMLAPVKSVH